MTFILAILAKLFCIACICSVIGLLIWMIKFGMSDHKNNVDLDLNITITTENKKTNR